MNLQPAIYDTINNIARRKVIFAGLFRCLNKCIRQQPLHKILFYHLPITVHDNAYIDNAIWMQRLAPNTYTDIPDAIPKILQKQLKCIV